MRYICLSTGLIVKLGGSGQMDEGCLKVRLSRVMRRRMWRTATVLLVGALTAPILMASPAAADASATVKARTQRMSAPNLNSPQNGWYNPGDRVSLTCSTHGQAVKGFFSFNIPNGGWDDLWYKTSDGNYVADVDIETGTLDAVAGDCSAPPPVQPPPAAQSSGLRWPLDAVNVTQWFGQDPQPYQPGGHNGIDLAASIGTPVYAADDGTVDFEGFGQNNRWMREPAGICVLLRHANYFTGYAHLSSTVIDRGQHVSKGQLIGYTGKTGLATGPHLHFEVLPLSPNFNNGFSGRIDPRPLLP